MQAVKRLTICGLEYRVVYATPDEVPELADNEGICRASVNTIYLRRNAPPSRMRDALLHEVLHAFLEASGVGAYLSQSFKGSTEEFESHEETLIRLVVPSLLRLVEDNGNALISIPASAAPKKNPSKGKTKNKKARSR